MDDQAVLDELSRLIVRTQRDLPVGLDVEAALKRTKERFRETPVVPLNTRRAPAPSVWSGNAFRIAAGLGMAVLGALVWSRSGNGREGQVAQVRTAPQGGPDSLTLADGSEVILAPGSRLTVDGTYGSDSRRLTLDGQGWFRVVHDDARPFVVTSGGAEIRDIGTVFVVEGSAEGEVRVSVQEGSVALRPRAQTADPEITLTAGDLATVRQGSAEVSKGGSTADEATWASGELRFRDVTLEQLSGTLERWYGVRVQVDASLKNQRVTTSLNGGSVRSVLNELALALEGEVVWVGDTATVRRREGMR